jgi:hypothetical protein
MRESIINIDLTDRIKEIRNQEGRAGGLPTLTGENFCPNCGASAKTGEAHALSCPKRAVSQQPLSPPKEADEYDYGCD